MAVFVDLDDDDVEIMPQSSVGHSTWNHANPSKHVTPTAAAVGGSDEEKATPEDNPNKENPAAEALACYPVVIAIASSIDLITLDNLSRTCRSIHSSLISYRRILMVSTLRCSYEDVPVDPEDTLRYRARAGNWFYMEDMTRAPSAVSKSGSCARDMVAECRRCGTVVCRNCTIKPPAPIIMKGRHRRLCQSCIRAPLTAMTKPPLPPDTPIDSPLVNMQVCSCATEGVWLCQPCGKSIKSADHEYRSIWRWRTQYREVLGGLGTGIGDGDRGVVCGRAEGCLGSKEREHEIDCEAEDMRWEYDHPADSASSSQISEPLFADDDGFYSDSSASSAVGARSREGSPSLGPGYARHEIEGIGGVVKKKLVKMVRVGACVPEWEDEKANRAPMLSREIDRRARSWCGWCWRVIPSKADLDTQGTGKAVA